MRRGGFALIELLVATGSGMLVVLLVAATLPIHARAFAGGRDRQELRSSLRRIVDGVAREARGLGFDPIVNPADAAAFDGRAEGIAVAEAARIEIRSDHHGAGGTGAPDDRLDAGSDERVSFSWSAGTRGVTQAIGGLNLSLAEGAEIRSGALVLRYFDACGHEVPLVAGTLGASARQTVASIAIAITGSSPGVGGAESASSRIALRNRRHLVCAFGAAA